ncbi:MAG: hypothetical protein KC583_05585, partial [Myxococcales bacterium]|nr:hypothetical protein [Myxococcales bacterium]
AVEGWRGPLLVRAQGDPTHPDGASGYADEARWTTLPWDAEQSLSALVPDFDPEQPSVPVVVTPLTDLAWARASSRGAPLLDHHAEAAALLAAHFALPSGEALRTLLPADPNTPTVAPGDAHRYLFALGCLARQALDVAETLAPEAPETFTALDLLAWYRADLAADGELDGAAGNEALPLEHEGRAVTLEDPFRADLAASCARWLADPANPSGLTRPQLTESLRAIANDTGALFDPAHVPTPFDVDGPSVEPRLEPVGEGTTAGLRTNGPARLTLTLRDAAGIVDARVEAPEGLAVTVERAFDLSTTPSEARWVALVEPNELPDGPLPFAIHADDALGNSRVQTVVIVKDTTPPTLTVDASEGVDTTYEFAWYTQLEQFEARFEIEDAGPWRIVEQSWSVFDYGGEPEPFPDGLRVIDETHLSLSCPEERRYRLVLHVEDDLGNRLRFEPYVRADRSPPTLDWLSLSYVDELNFDHRGRQQDGQSVTRRGREDIEGSLVRKWQTRWGPDDANPAVLRVKGVPGGVVESPVVALAWRAALHGRFGPWRELTRIPNRIGEADIVLDAAGLGFDPIGNPPGPGTRPEIEVRVTDRAGNTFEDSIRLELAVIPPALEIEWLDDYHVDGYVRLDEISLEDESFGRIWEGGGGLGVLVGGLRVRNPHGVDVEIFTPEDLVLSVDVAAAPWILDGSSAQLGAAGLHPTRQPIEEGARLQRPLPVGDPCGLPMDALTFIVRPRVTPYEFGGIHLPVRLYPGECEAAPDVTERFNRRAAIELVDSSGGISDAVVAPARSGATLVGVATRRLPRLAEVTAVGNARPQAFTGAADTYRYVSNVQSGWGGGFVPDRHHCFACFQAEVDCAVDCQDSDYWFGARVQAITDARVQLAGPHFGVGLRSTSSAPGRVFDGERPPSVRLRSSLPTFSPLDGDEG